MFTAFLVNIRRNREAKGASQLCYGLQTRYRREQLPIIARTILQKVKNLQFAKIRRGSE